MNSLVVLKNQYLEVKICPQVGAGIVSMRYNREEKWVDVMRPTPLKAIQNGKAGEFASFNMIPYSNRLKDAILKFQNKIYTLKANTPEGHSIHGDVRFRPWRILFEDAKSIEMGFYSKDFENISWPFPFYSQVTYSIDGSSLFINLTLENVGNQVMPGGMGIHPYFMRKLTEKDNTVYLRCPMKGIYPGCDTIPTGYWVDVPNELDFSHEKELGIEHLDKCYRISPCFTIIGWPGSGVTLTMAVDKIFKHMIIYCPKDCHDFFAVEPVTNCNNGFNMAEEGVQDTGTIYIEPGQIITGSIRIKLEAI